MIAASTDIGVAGSAEGTVFPTSINRTKINSLFDTGATKSVMSGEMYRRLKLGPLDTNRLPKVVRANGASLGAKGRISCEINIGEQTFKQTFLVWQNITRPVILERTSQETIVQESIGQKTTLECLQLTSRNS